MVRIRMLVDSVSYVPYVMILICHQRGGPVSLFSVGYLMMSYVHANSAWVVCYRPGIATC